MQSTLTTALKTASGAHSSPTADVIENLETSADGLDAAEVQNRLDLFGPNAFPSAPKKSAFLRFASQFNDVLIYILIAAAILKAIIGDWVEFSVIAFATVAIASVGFIQEGRADQALAGIKSMLALDAQVKRNGKWSVVNVEDLVPGDVVRLRSGDRVPADLRIISSKNLNVDEAILTGESVPSEKSSEPVSEGASVGDRYSMVYSGTIVTSGIGEGVVTATGLNTEIGQITTMVSEVEELQTPLARQMAHLGKQIAIIIAILAVIMVAVGALVHGFDGYVLLSATISFAVAAVPEGLPALVTITLALGVQQMAKRRAIARKMAAIETLGSVDVICTDKTGTLTQNEMTATVVEAVDRTYTVTGTGYAPVGEIHPSGLNPALTEMMVAAATVNEAKLEQTETGWRVVGPPTEGALTVLLEKSGFDVSGYQHLAQIPFESAHKFSAALSENSTGERFLHVVGAPDRLLARSTHDLTDDGRSVPIDLEAWETRMEALSSRGLRMLGVAYTKADGLIEPTLEDAENLTFLGVVGIVDPPRPEVKVAIQQAHRAGIDVKMITGDHVGTALAIASELSIGEDEGELLALTGAELEQMSDAELAEQAPHVDVYARTSPEHKIRIVAALQSHGDVVAMTGDGVNDAPSIAQADVGVAMGIKGTEATKEAAEIVLQDDNFATITAAVEEGRRIYDNIRKSVVFMLPTNGAQSLVVLVAILAGWALPLTPVQILWINLITAVTLSIPLAVEPAEPGIMERTPREPDQQILSGRTLLFVLGVSALIGSAALIAYRIVEGDTGNVVMAQTTALSTLAVAQMAYLFNARILGGTSFSVRAFTGNSSVWLAVGAMIILQLLLVYVPWLNTLFGTAPMPALAWGLAIGFAVVVFVAVEGLKVLVRPAANVN